MYFTNINNPELNKYHGTLIKNFTITLTDILHKTNGEYDNKLFKIEEIITDKIYKIYPIFNTKEITSSNPSDKILENRCIIAQKQTKETRITFRSDNGTVYDYVDYGSYYNIGDSLTTAQFNAIVQLIRNNITLTDYIRVKNGTINGEYGKYTFDIDSTTIVDNGILITDETLSNLGTVELTDPELSYSTYTLYLTVYSMENANIMTDETTSDITTTTLEIELIEDTEVNIPFNTLDKSTIVGFDARIDIKQDKPIIIIPEE